MSSLNINYNGNSIPIADIGIVSSKEKVILGNLERDLVIQTLGSVNIQVGNKFYELSFSSENNNATISSNIEYINSISDISISSYEDGVFIFDISSESLYIVYNGSLKLLAGKESSNKIFLSFMEDQIITGEQKQRLCFNSGSCIKTLDDIKLFSQSNVYENQVIFIQSEKQHYILNNVHFPNLISSWETFYVGSNGGVISNGLTINNKTRENLLYLNGIDNLNSSIFNGLKIGDNDSSLKLSVNSNNQSVISYNTKELLIKDSSNTILRTSDGRIGIGGNPSGSNSYKITIDGTTRFTSPVFTDSKISSTDYISTNVSHWDGGQGFGLIRGGDGKWSIELDNVLVRGSLIANKLTLKELEVERVYATGGHMLITDGANVNSYSYRKPTEYEWRYANTVGQFTISTTTLDGGTISNTYTGLGGNYGTLDENTFYYFITFKESTEKDDNNAYVSLPTDVNPIATEVVSNISTQGLEQDTLDAENNCPFIYGDVLLCQTASGLTAKKYYCLVSYSTNKYIAVQSSDFRNNNIYERDSEGNITGVYKDFSIASGDNLIRVTNIAVDELGKYIYANRRRFIDIDGTRNQITMYDNMGKSDSFSGGLIDNKYYEDVNIITGIKQDNGSGALEQGALKLRMGRLDDLGISGLGGYGLYADNVYLKGKLIVKNDDLETFVGANRGQWILNNVNTYYENDLVTYIGSVYRCITKHKNTDLLQQIPGISGYWEIWVQKGADGVAGNLFRYVEISGEQVFVFNEDTQAFEKNNIPLTCTAFNIDYVNFTKIRFDWKVSGTTIYSKPYLKSEVTSGNIVDSFDVYASGLNNSINWDNYWNNGRSLTIRCLAYVDDSEIYDSDTFSLYKIYNGKSNYTWIKYSPNSNGVPMQDDPDDMKYIGIAINQTSPTESEDPSVYQWSLIKGSDGSYVTFVYTASTATPQDPTGTPNSVDLPWSLSMPTVTEDAKYVWMSYVQTAKDGFIGAWEKPIRITGEDGQPGTDGTSLEFIYKLSNETSESTPSSENTDNFIPSGWTNNPTGISELYIYEYISTRSKVNNVWGAFSVPAIWSKWGQKGQDGAGVEYIYSRTTEYNSSLLPALINNPSTDNYIPTGWTNDPIGVTEEIMYEWVSMRRKLSGAISWENFSNPALWAKWGEDGSDSLSGVLTNDSATVISDSDGVISDYSLANGIFNTYYGTNNVTSSTTFSVFQKNNCDGTINSTTGEYSISSLTADSGTLVLLAEYTPVGKTKLSITKIFSISKTKTGANGEPAIMYVIEPTTFAISKDSSSVYSPSNVTFNFYKYTGALKEVYTGYYKTSYYNGSDWNYLVTKGNASTTGAIEPFSTYKIMRCELYSDSGYTKQVDLQTIIIIQDGSNGYNAGNIQITGDQIFKYRKNTTTPVNNAITLTTSTQYITGTIYYVWSYYNIYSQSWVSLTESSSSLGSYTFDVSLMTYSENGVSLDHDSIRIRCTANGYTDEITLVKMYDGSEAINVLLSNESHIISCDSDEVAKTGELGTSGKAYTNISVYKGTTLLSNSNWSYGAFTKSNVDIDSATKGIIYITSIASFSGYVDIPIVINKTTYTKRFSVAKSIDGASGSSWLTGMLTNDSVTLVADSSGVVSDYSNATGTFKVYYGTTDITTSSSFSYVATNCTGTIESSTGVYSVSSFLDGYSTGYLTLTATYQSKSVSKIFSVSKAMSGISGTSPTVYSIKPSVNTIVRSYTNTYSPSSVTFTFYKTTGSSSPVLFSGGSAKVYTSSDGSGFSLKNSLSSVSSITGTPIYAEATKYIKCDLYSDSSYKTLVDSQIILVVADGNPGNNGTDAFTIFFTNESINIPSLNNGQIPSSVLTDYNFNTNLVIYSGSNKATYLATTGYGYTVSQSGTSPITTSITNSGGVSNIRITKITQTLSNGSYTPISASADFTIVIKKDNVTIATITKTLYITASKQGDSGVALQWIQDWDGQSTETSAQGIITPKIFAGTKSESNITGVMIGKDVFGLTENGIAGYYNSQKTFHLNSADGSFQFGTGNSLIAFNPTTNRMSFGSNISLNWTNYADQIYSNIKSKSPNIIPYSNAIHSITQKQYAYLNYTEFQQDPNKTNNASLITANNSNYRSFFRIGTTESYSNINLEIGKQYTFSIYVKNVFGNGNIKLRFADISSDVINISNSWSRISYTSIFSTTQPTWKFVDIVLQNIGDQVYIWRPQVEISSAATPWAPYQGEDVQSGRNLLINSDFKKGIDYWLTSGSFKVDISGSNDYIGHKPIKYTGNTNDQEYYSIYKNISSLLKTSTTYTLSCYAKYDNNIAIKIFGLYLEGSPYKYNVYSIGDSDWKKYTLTFTTSTTISPNQRIGWYCQDHESNPCSVWLTMFKLEEGFNATDWSQAPEDINSTYIDSNGIYTGTLSAEKITTGTLSADRIAAGSINSSKLLIDDSITVGGILHNGSILVKDDQDVRLVLLDRKGITATGGTIGGWTIEQNRLSATGTNAELNVDLAVNQMLHINDTTFNGQEAVSGNLISIRADNITGISIYTQSPSGVGIYLMAQTGAYAIKSHGSHYFYQRPGEVWNAPGVLWAGTVKKASGSSIEGSALNITNEWGNGLVITSTSYHPIGRYRFNHNLGRSDYMVFTQFHLDAYGDYWKCACKIEAKTDTYFDIQCFDTYKGYLVDGLIDVMVVGRNYYNVKK